VIDLAPFTSGSRERILAALIESGDAFVLRERLVDVAGVPPIRLVRLLAEIGEAGIPIETRPGEGHRLAARRAPLDLRRVEAALAALSKRSRDARASRRSWRVLRLASVTSTNDVALALADAAASDVADLLAAGASHVADLRAHDLGGAHEARSPAVERAHEQDSAIAIVAESQTRGRGRESRAWHSAPCAGLWTSLLVRPRLAAADAYLLTLGAAVAAVRAARYAAGVSLAIKWPNDLVAPLDAAAGDRPFGAKVGGILAEARSRGPTLDFGIIGIGINVDLGRDEFPPELRELAVSLRDLAGRPVSREDLLAALLDETSAVVADLESGRAARLLDEFRSLSSLTGRRVTIRAGERALSGIVRGFDDDGALRLEQSGGAIERVIAGEATLQEGGR
jgi:BirA family biotin operon repressor/biotin-[acetyl-CoA-carboxylase] ligase